MRARFFSSVDLDHGAYYILNLDLDTRQNFDNKTDPQHAAEQGVPVFATFQECQRLFEVRRCRVLLKEMSLIIYCIPCEHYK